MNGIYRSRWEKDWTLTDRDGTWFKALKHLDRRQLKIGLIKLAKTTKHWRWPPNPLEFRGLCEVLPEDLDWPTENDAWEEVTHYSRQPASHPWSHLAVKMAGQETGWFAITHAETDVALDKLKKQFCKAYKTLAKAVFEGAALEPVEQLEDLTGEQERHGQQELEKTMKGLGIDPAMSGSDARKKLLSRFS
ncbi:hypothetical protein [Endozoicomonas sp. Mp262]|uniref:hypothetical protein n=1 Tax=Endozoicomonas sp. Mp262 TaxID=2919499 RepID=UPI0021D81C3F